MSRADLTRSVPWPVAAGTLFVIALAARVAELGNPIVQTDEQFYLLVGGRMLHGLVPYVDVWDRKPIGLFLLFAGFRALGGSGVLIYQLAGLVSVWATSLLLFAIARRVAPARGALVGAILYPLCLDLASGQGGQAPIYYNLLVVAAIALVFFGRDGASGAAIRWRGAAAMLLFGVAMQLKYSCVFEGIFAGVMLIASARAARRSPLDLALDILLWVGCAVLPTALAASVYWRIGHFPEWWYANVVSILARGHEPPETVRMRIGILAALVAPFVLCVPLRRWLGCRPESPEERAALRFLDGWAATALLGVVLFGTWFNHYALPLFAPLAVTAAPLWRRKAGRTWLLVLVVTSAILGQVLIALHHRAHGDARVFAAAVAATRGMHNCLFVYDGYPALYDATNSCFPTTRPFQTHLHERNEMGATGIDEAGEVQRVMANRPDRVMTVEPGHREENPAARAALYRGLANGYRPVFRYRGGGKQILIYGRDGTIPRDLAPVAP